MNHCSCLLAIDGCNFTAYIIMSFLTISFLMKESYPIQSIRIWSRSLDAFLPFLGLSHPFWECVAKVNLTIALVVTPWIPLGAYHQVHTIITHRAYWYFPLFSILFLVIPNILLAFVTTAEHISDIHKDLASLSWILTASFWVHDPLCIVFSSSTWFCIHQY